MPPTPSLNVRPTFNRAVTDESIIPMAHLDRTPSGRSQRMTPNEPSPHQGGATDSYFEFSPSLSRPVSQMSQRPLMQPPQDSPVQTGPRTRMQQVQSVAFENAARVLPYWREGLFVATTIGMATWLGVVTGRMRALEDVPFCIVP